jgi:hypothetical protein
MVAITADKCLFGKDMYIRGALSFESRFLVYAYLPPRSKTKLLQLDAIVHPDSSSLAIEDFIVN